MTALAKYQSGDLWVSQVRRFVFENVCVEYELEELNSRPRSMRLLIHVRQIHKRWPEVEYWIEEFANLQNSIVTYHNPSTTIGQDVIRFTITEAL